MTHSKKVEEMAELAKQINPDKRVLYVMKIKLNLELIQNNKIHEAHKVLQ
jgi:hypothetical protein